MANLLKNPGFEGAFRNWNGDVEISVAEDWFPFWVAHLPTDEAWKNQRPIYRPATRLDDPRRVRAGQSAQAYYTTWATHVAGIMQVVPVTPGMQLRLTAYGHAWSTDADTPEQSSQPGQVRMKVGIDPSGGTNPFASQVVWSSERAVYDSYDAGFMVETVATGLTATVFLVSAPEWPKKHNSVYWDDAQLEVTSEAGEPHTSSDVLLTLESPNQMPDVPVAVVATSEHELFDVQVIVSGPSGSLQADYKGVQRQGAGFVWRWEFVPPVEGPYTVTLAAEGVPAISSNLRIAATRPAQPGATTPQPLPPVPPAPPSTGMASRGKPRAQYHRVYVLLPPTAGKDWIQAVIDSGAWERERWTVGYSADDAGLGDLDRRTVIVVNPSAWPDPIIPWLEMWYPGVAAQPVTAISPDDLRTVLQAADKGAKPQPGPEFG